MSRNAARLAPVLLAAALGATAGAAPAPAATVVVVRATLLQVPAAAPGERVGVTAADVSPLGVVAGTAQVTTTAASGTPSVTEAPQRWARVPRAGWLRQRLALPEGATSGTVTGLTDPGEAAGSVTVGGTSRAVRWSLDGRSATLIGDARSRVSAVGPHGPWGVSTGGADPVLLTGEAELVGRDGARVPLRGTPELEAGYRRTVASISGADTALVWVVDGIGRGTTGRPVLWHDGATVRLPVTDSAFLAAACVSRVLPGGSVVAGGYDVATSPPSVVLVRHVGGVPGTDVVLSRASAPGQRVAGLGCGGTPVSNALAPDGGVAGFVSDAGGQRAAYWDAANTLTVVPLAAGERSASGVVAASGGRMVIQAEGADGVVRLSLWDDGVRTRLAAPAGWAVASVVELTDAGLLVATLRDADGTMRPAAWQLG